MKKTVDKRVHICYNHHVAKNKRVCWNWQTGTFEGRVSLAYGFKSRHSHHKSTVILIELRWAFSIPENRLESGFSAVRAHKRTPLQAILRRGFVRFRRIVAFCAVVIVKQPSNR